MTQQVKMVAFDLGYTLAFNAREDYYIDFLKEHHIYLPLEEVELAFHYADEIFMREYSGMLGRHSKYHFPWYLGIVNYHLGQQFDLNKQSQFILAKMNMETYWRLFSWTKEVLTELKEEEYQVALLSNWDLSCRHLMNQFEIAHLFDHILVSSEVGIEKPDQRIFEMLMNQSGLYAEEIIYVGDNYYDDVQGSRKKGIDTILINRFGHEGVREIDDCHIVKSTKDVYPLLKNEENDGFLAMEKIKGAHRR
ncbi:MAG TPA: HAD-IA family hydrolase [Pseudogracilibacillus sp.]|nr:HAD-IA family hydrolase [Pseudogracilibacillus sp.]